MTEHGRLARSFDATAEAYELGRPEYPLDAIEWWSEKGAFPPRGVVVDLAAGTGKLTRGLAGRGATVIAIEPLPNMRVEFRKVLPDIDLLDGSAEYIALPDASVDTVFVAQAFHWFDAPVALAEIARVLRPGGGLGMIWNGDDIEGASWMQTVAGGKRALAGPTVSDSARAAAAAVAASGRFTPIEETVVAWTETTTRERVLANVLSRSSVTVLGEEERRRVLAPIEAALAEQPEPLRYPHLAHVFWCTRD